MTTPYVHSTHLSPTHTFSKSYTPSITLLQGLGVHGDVHSGKTVQQRRLSSQIPTAPNLRQVHLIPYELFNELSPQGFAVAPGQLGENITTYGIDLLGLPRGSYLYFGEGGDVPVVQVTGLREPGEGVERFMGGLLGKVKYISTGGNVVRRCGIMGVVVKGGVVATGAAIRIVQPEKRYALEVV
ncbi:MOSC domain-containing protein 2 [Tothia fuscella]|uniref:MOSC domain-containing protein 2 n=1 Tax=Tothia fuscella TaxID=1048955 RepID=A0A9P4NIP9_9PEZI|nr:MOSC domain-containing protein 2 [Tothia fuscella]